MARQFRPGRLQYLTLDASPEIIVALVMAMLLGAGSAAAQTLGESYVYRCPDGQPTCLQQAPVQGTREYERWQDGTPARGSGSSTGATEDPSPHYFHGYNSLYGFGR